MNMNGSQPNLVDTVIPPDFLTKLHVGRCALDFKEGCTTPGALFTDVNVWSRALEKEEAVKWTSCRSDMKGDLLNWETGWCYVTYGLLTYFFT